VPKKRKGLASVVNFSCLFLGSSRTSLAAITSCAKISSVTRCRLRFRQRLQVCEGTAKQSFLMNIKQAVIENIDEFCNIAQRGYFLIFLFSKY